MEKLLELEIFTTRLDPNSDVSRELNYNPPYNVTAVVPYGHSRDFRLLRNSIDKRDPRNINRMMCWYAPHILKFYERDCQPIDDAIRERLTESPEHVIDFKVIFGWIIDDSTRVFGSYRRRLLDNIYKHCGSGDAWSACCAQMYQILTDKNKGDKDGQLSL